MYKPSDRAFARAFTRLPALALAAMLMPMTAAAGVSTVEAGPLVTRPLFVAETRNATCLIRPAVLDRGAWPR